MAPRALLACLAVAGLAAGCGGTATRSHVSQAPKLPRALADRWAGEADQVAAAAAAGDGCRAQQLARSLGADVSANAAQVPSRLRTPLLTAVTTLVGRVTCTPPPPQPESKPKDKKQKPPGHDHGHDHGHGPKGHGGGHGDGG